MPPIKLDEKWLSDHPQVAERIRQAEAAQQAPPVTAAAVPEPPRINEQARPYIPMPPKSETSPRRPFWHYLAAGAVLVLVWVAVMHITDPNRAAYLNATNQHVAQVTAGGQQQTQQPTVSQPAQDTSQPASTVTFTNGPVASTTAPQSQPDTQTTQASPSQQPAVSQPAAQTTQTVVQPQPAQVIDPSWANSLLNLPLPLNIVTTVVMGRASTQTAYGTETLSVIALSIGRSWLHSGNQFEIILNLDGKTIYKYLKAQDINGTIEALASMPPDELVNGRMPITGQIANDDLSVTLEVSGPNGVKTIQGKIDSGTVKSTFPEAFLQSLGYTPVSSQAVLGVTGQQTEGVYDVPDIQIQGNNGQWETLYDSTLQVWGDQFNEALIGADVLQQDSLSVSGNTFTLSFPN